VAILGSVVALVFVAFTVASLFVATPQPRPPNSAQAIMASAAIFTALAAIGIWTSVGLFRLRPWARTSSLIFAGFIAASCVFALVITMAVVGVLMNWSLAIAVAVALTAIWFLGHDRPAFVRAENARDWPGLHT
jgi:hypothetical protein